MRRFLLVGLVVLSAGLAFGQRVTVEATVNARRIGTEDVLELTVSVNGGNGTPRFPSIDGFRVSGPSTSSRFSIVNGRTSSTSSFTYQLVPQSEGTFTIPAIPVDVDGRTYETAPIRVEVVAGSVMPRRPRSRGFDPFGSRQRRREPEITAEDVFVRADVSKRSVYQGEGVVITYRVYSKYMPHGPEVDDDPPLTGFWVEEVNLGNPSIERQVVNGQEYLTFPMKQRVVFPARTGELTIPLLTLSMAFRITSSDPFDAFFCESLAADRVALQRGDARCETAPASRARPRFHRCGGGVRARRGVESGRCRSGEPGDADTRAPGPRQSAFARASRASGYARLSHFRSKNRRAAARNGRRLRWREDVGICARARVFWHERNRAVEFSIFRPERRQICRCLRGAGAAARVRRRRLGDGERVVAGRDSPRRSQIAARRHSLSQRRARHPGAFDHAVFTEAFSSMRAWLFPCFGTLASCSTSKGKSERKRTRRSSAAGARTGWPEDG